MATLRLWFDPHDKALRQKAAGMPYPRLEVHSDALDRTINLAVDEQYGYPFHQLNLNDVRRLPNEVRDHVKEVTLEEVVAGPLAKLLPQGRWEYRNVRWEVKGEPAPGGWAVRIFVTAPSVTHVIEWLRAILTRVAPPPEKLYYQPSAPAPTAEDAATPAPVAEAPAN